MILNYTDATVTAAASPPLPTEKVAVLITSTNSDADLSLANLIKGQIFL